MTTFLHTHFFQTEAKVCPFTLRKMKPERFFFSVKNYFSWLDVGHIDLKSPEKMSHVKLLINKNVHVKIKRTLK